MKDILVTGAGGFVGRELVRLLLGAGHQVRALDLRLDGLPQSEQLTRIEGLLDEESVRKQALGQGVDAVIHLATVPGAAAELDPAGSRRVNIDAMYDLMLEAAAARRCPRFVYASSIAVLGDPLPDSGVTDETPLLPRMVYGAHKAMMETAVALMSQREEIDGVTVRLPGILARPPAPSGMKSAFMSDLFHALMAEEKYTCPVSPQAMIWAQSITQCALNFVHALQVKRGFLPAGRAMTLPALRFSIGDMVAEIARQCGTDSGLVSYRPDTGLEAAFGRYPSLETVAADAAGFSHDQTLEILVQRAMEHIRLGR